MSITPDIIKKFMKKMDMKVFASPEFYDDKLRVHFKVKRGNETQYFSYDHFKLKPNGEVDFRLSEDEVGVSDGLLAFLGDEDEVTNFLLDMSREFAQKMFDDKIKS